ncbi:MAG TPA: hypothetical protein VGR76_04650 [Candidatus Angelobacter sp.]|nr:hypothetical protein [Candidatus Angelobacter sp.]
MVADEFSLPAAIQLSIEDVDKYGRRLWKPVKIETPQSQLQEVYAELPARFPKLFERMLLSYRWAEVDLGTYTLLANPSGDDFSGFFQQMTNNPFLWAALLPTGFIPFGKGPDLDYDPVCFDIKARRQGGDYRIVKINHEEILCNNRVKIVAELAPSFYQLVLQTIERAKQRPSSEPD